jgi:hypothetical protein
MSRTLLQDTVSGSYRYPDTDFRRALVVAFDEAYRIRPDFFVNAAALPNFISAAATTVVPVPLGYQSAFMYYITGLVQLQDQEETSDARAGTFLQKFTAQLLSTAA